MPSRRRRRPRPRHDSRPSCERLEERYLLFATTGGSWAHPIRITYSFIPDGADLGGAPSQLDAVLSPRLGAQAWRDQFRRAAATWQAVAGINLAEVSDNGSTLGIAGNQQDDPRFGDIRIGGRPLDPTYLAIAFATPPYNGGTLAGDIVLNTSYTWQINTNYDLLTVAIHEFGHALGMGHSQIAQADMYAYYTGMKQGLTTDDTDGIQTIYGARQPDVVDQSAPNDSWRTAWDLSPWYDPYGRLAFDNVELTTSNDADWYRLVVPTTTNGSLIATMQAANLSSVAPQLSLYRYSNGVLTSLGACTQAYAYGSMATVGTPGVTPGQVYYLRANGANPGPGSVGLYGMLINFGSVPLYPLPPPDTTVPQAPDQGGGASGMAVGGEPGSHGREASQTILQGLSVDLPSLLRLGNVQAQGDALTAAELGWARVPAVPPNLPARPVTPAVPPNLGALAGWAAWIIDAPGPAGEVASVLLKRDDRSAPRRDARPLS